MGGEVIGAVLGAAVVGAIGGVISGAVGSGIMHAANHTGYNVLESVEMGATGGGVFMGGMALVAGLSSFGLFQSRGHMASTGLGFILNCFLSGLIGYAILHEATPVVAMDLAETAIAFAVGSLVFSGSASVVALTAVCCGILVCGCHFKNQSQTDTFELHSDVSEHFHPNYGATEMHHNLFKKMGMEY